MGRCKGSGQRTADSGQRTHVLTADRRPPTARAGRLTRLLGVLALVGGAAGCTELDYFLTRFEFLAFMDSSPALDPYEAPRPAPPGAVPFAAPGGPFPSYPEVQATEASLLAFAAEVSNPVPMTEETLEAGKLYYDRYCAVCHGVTGEGNGPVVGPGRFPFAPNLLLPITQQRTDGYLYAVITAGRGLMPSYRRMAPMERWYVVNYLRHLQQQPGGGSAPAAGTAAPAAGQAAPAPGGE